MKNIIISLLCTVLFISCKKDEDTTAAAPSTHTVNIGSVPSSFAQKVILELFTGAGQAACTDGFDKEKAITDAYPSNAIPVYIHFSDAMEIPYYTYLDSVFNNQLPPPFPSGLVNRTPSLGMVILNRTQWLSNFNVAKTKSPVCGLALKTTISGNQVSVEVHSGFIETLTGNYNLVVMMLENNVTGSGNQFDQRNSYNTAAGHSYYGLGDPIVGFKHDHVLRKMISNNGGDLIPSASMVPGGHYVKTYTYTLVNCKADDAYIVAFIDKAGSSANTHEIQNAQQVKLGSTIDWN